MLKVKSMYSTRYGLVELDKIVNPYPPEGTERYFEKEQHFLKLVESVRSNGIRNPLVGESYPDGTVVISVGYSRAWAAKKAGLDKIPVFVNDLANLFSHFELIDGIDKARMFFTDQPIKIIFTKKGISTSEPLVDDKTWWN